MSLPLTTYIQTPKGYTSIRNLKEGDVISTWRGKPTEIISMKFTEEASLYRVTFDNGKHVDVGDDQLWSVVAPYSSKFDCTEENLYEAQKWTVRIYGSVLDTAWILTTFYKKYVPLWIPKAYCDGEETRLWRKITNVIPLRCKEAVIGIGVDHPDGLFIIDNHTVVHGLD